MHSICTAGSLFKRSLNYRPGFRAASLFITAVLGAGFAGNALAAASDTIAGAQPITLPYFEIVDNSSFTADPADHFCSEGPAGDFFYRFTPTETDLYWILAEGLDTEIYVFDLSDVGNEEVQCQDDDNIFSYFATQTYGWEIADDECNECSETMYVELEAGTEYIIAAASHSSSSQGLIRVNIGLPDPSALVQAPSSPQSLASDSLAGAQTISLPYFEIVDNSTFSADSADDFCDQDPAGDFFYKYTPATDETVIISAESVDAEFYVFDLADVGNEDWYCSDEDNAASFFAAGQSLSDLLDDECFECSEAYALNMDAGTEYIIAIASNSDETRGPTRVNIRLASDYPVAAPPAPPAPTIPVPFMPLWALTLLAVLLGGVGMSRLRARPA